MKGSATNRQLVFTIFIACVALTTITIPHDLSLSAGRGAWVTLIIAALIFAIMAVIIVKLNRMYEGKMLIEYSRDIGGGFISYVLGIFYSLYFLFFEITLLNTSSKIAEVNFMIKTPQWALILVLIPVFGYIAYKGLTTAVRLAEIFCIWFLLVAAVTYITMLIQGDLEYVLPLFTASKTGDYIAALKDVFPSFLGIEVLTILPMGKNNTKAPRTVFFLMLGICIFYILDVYGSYAMIGMDEIIFHTYPLIDAIRLVQYPSVEFLQRVDVSYMTFGFIRIFIAEGIMYMALVEILCKILPKVKRIVVVLASGAMIVALSIVSLSIQDVNVLLKGILGYAGIAAAFVIPLTLFVIAKVKKRGKKSA